MITIKDLEIRYGAKQLFGNVNLQLMPGQRYGLIGANGSGKTTFLRILSGTETQFYGQLRIPSQCRVGVMEQDQFKYDSLSLIQTVLAGRPKLFEAAKLIDSLITQENLSDQEAQLLADQQALFENENGYAAEAEAAKMLVGLGFTDQQHDQPMSSLSGGYKIRVLLAKVLFSEPELLLLDEPTNHLDLYSIRWLEIFLKKFTGALVVISHDRRFLNSVCTKMLDVDYGGIRAFNGNYDQFERQIQEERQYRDAVLQKTEKKKDELQGFVDKFRSKATKARQAQSKLRLIEKLGDEIESQNLQPSSRQKPHLSFNLEQILRAAPLRARGISKSYGEKKVLHDVGFDLENSDRMAVIGPNGIGKSTLLKILVDDLTMDQGEALWTQVAQISYFPQDLDPLLQNSCTCLEWLNNHFPKESEGEIRKALARSLFSGDDSKKKVSTLSGGEKARLVLAKISLEKRNVLILDEPTNHLDIEGIEGLTDALLNYSGTLLFVSHNRWFVSKLANRILEILPDQVKLHECGYEQAIEGQAEDHLNEEKAKSNKASSQSRPYEPSTPAQKAEKKKLKNKIDQLENKIEKLELKKEDLQSEMSDPKLYLDSGKQQLQELTSKLNAIQTELEQHQTDWEKLLTKFEGMA